ncbi:hypothetical protein QM583_08590, partial [Gordonia alkanivorans]|uniref:hypothetical protein n=1 Tax=Gordonia alkanivorans TaxID=84096 RepID=UPI0024B732AD
QGGDFYLATSGDIKLAVDKRVHYLQENDLDDLPLNLESYLTFFKQRRSRIRDRLVEALGSTPGQE